MRQDSLSAVPSCEGGSAPAAGEETGGPFLAQVWGDTVDIRHLGVSVVIGVAMSMGAFLAGRSLLASWVRDPEIAHACSMLVGLCGCLLAGAICAVLFKPKRIVAEQAIDAAGRAEVLRLLAAQAGGIGSIADLSPSAKAELAELGILDIFARAEPSASQPDSASPVSGAHGAQTGAC